MERIKISETGTLDSAMFVSMSIDTCDTKSYHNLIAFLDDNNCIFDSMTVVSGGFWSKNVIRVKFLIPQTKVFDISKKIYKKVINEA